MPLPACFQLADDVFPRVRAEAARRLLADGWNQTRTADALRVSQAMVSKYGARTEAETDALVLQLTDELLRDLDQPSPTNGPSAWCNVLAPADSRPGANDALQDLLAAERRLLDEPPVRAVPQIGLNMVRATKDAEAPDDVLAFPGRMVAVGSRLVTPAPPAWGASTHMARCLLALRGNDAAPLAMANIRGNPATVAAATQAGLTVTPITRASDDDSDTPVLAAFTQGATVVHDPGAVGLEPCLYISGPDAVAVAAHIQSIHNRLTQ